MSVPVASISICVGRSRHLPVLCRCEPSGLETVPKTGPLCVPLFGDTVRSRIVCGDSLPFAYYICPCIAAPVSESYSTLPASSSELPRGCNGYRFGAERAGRGAGCCRINRRSGPNSGGASGERNLKPWGHKSRRGGPGRSNHEPGPIQTRGDEKRAQNEHAYRAHFEPALALTLKKYWKGT